jgi:hypothetical protein
MGITMTSHNIEPPSVSEICDQVKHLGYAVSDRIRLYGEEFEVLSDPFPEDDGIAVRVKQKRHRAFGCFSFLPRFFKA